MPTPPKPGLPMAWRLFALTCLLGLLIWHVMYDATHANYEGGSFSLLIGGILGGAIALDQNAKNKGGDE